MDQVETEEGTKTTRETEGKEKESQGKDQLVELWPVEYSREDTEDTRETQVNTGIEVVKGLEVKGLEVKGLEVKSLEVKSLEVKSLEVKSLEVVEDLETRSRLIDSLVRQLEIYLRLIYIRNKEVLLFDFKQYN